MEILPNSVAIIPASGHYKKFPRKHVRLLHGKPLLAYTIEAVINSGCATDVYVSTDDSEIEEISKLYGAEVIKRPASLSAPTIPLKEVILKSLEIAEAKNKKRYDYVFIFEPTFPLLKSETISAIANKFSNKGYGSLISGRKSVEEFWKINDGHVTTPSSDPLFVRNGAIIITKRKFVKEDSLIDSDPHVFELGTEESTDVDTYSDWWIAENLLRRKMIVFRTEGSKEVGLGHIYRTVTLANKLSLNHKIFFVMEKNKKLGIRKVEEYNYPIINFQNEKEFEKILYALKPDIVINDILDTDKEYVEMLKKAGIFVVNFEDLGTGTESADMVINALYDNEQEKPNHLNGYKYECLRDEFYIYEPKKTAEKVENILITFGGTDPNNLSLRTLKTLRKDAFKDVRIEIVLGLGYSDKTDIEKLTEEMHTQGFKITIHQNIKMMSKFIHNADLVITANGRTIYEVVSMGVPCISIAQNERESRHLFFKISDKIIYLGLGTEISEKDISENIISLCNDYKRRKLISSEFLKFDIKGGIDRVVDAIFRCYKINQ